MASPAVECFRPTTRSFAGMKRILFQPFDVGKWFVLGFSAWLAGLLDGHGGGGGGTEGPPGEQGRADGEFFRGMGEWASDHLALVIGVGAVLLLIGVTIFLLLLWLSSRGKFMFLDNVLHNRAEVKIPWNRFRELGDSLFRWRLVFTVVVLLLISLIIGAFALFAVVLGKAAWWLALVLGILVLLPIGLMISYISTLLEDFVIPMMYRDSHRANDAWRRFLSFHRTAVGSFVLYFLWKALLWIVVIMCIIVVGLGTCLIGFFIMIIPYLGAVLLLPVSVFFRFLGPEFLSQFGGDYEVMASTVATPENGG